MKVRSDSSEKWIFRRYNEKPKSYKLYDLVTMKFIINKDVKFKEEEAWDVNIHKLIVVGVEIPQSK